MLDQDARQYPVMLIKHLESIISTRISMPKALRAFYCVPGRDESSAIEFLFNLGALHADTRCEFKRNSIRFWIHHAYWHHRIEGWDQKPIWRFFKSGSNSKRPIQVARAFFLVRKQAEGPTRNWAYM